MNIEIPEQIKSAFGMMSTRFNSIVLFILILAIYGYIFKLPMMCYGCETPDAMTSMFFRCIIDTSKDSEMCKISKDIENLPNEIADSGKKMTQAIMNELSSNLPETIGIAYKNIMVEIQRIVDLILATIDGFKEKIIGFMNEAFLEVKDIAINSYQELYALIITPILNFIKTNITNPILALIQKLVEFKDLIASTISTSYTQITGEILKVQTALINAVSSIPSAIEDFINILVDVVNVAVEGTIDETNKGIGTVVGFTNNSIDDMAKTANSATEGIVNTSKIAVGGVQDAVNKSIKFINEETIDKINILIDPGVSLLSDKLTKLLVDPLNKTTKDLSKVTGDAINPIVGVVNEVGGTINKIIDFEIPSIRLPQMDIPEADLKIAKIPAWTLIKETKLTDPIKILKDAKKLDKVNPPNLAIGEIGKIVLDVPAKMKRIENVSIPVNYSIPKIGPPPGNDPGVYIKVKKDLIPKPEKVNGGTPKDGKRNPIGMEKGGFIGQIDLDPAVDAIKKELNKPVDAFNSEIQKVYNSAMAPINNMIVLLLSSYEAIKGAIDMLFEKYINMEFVNYVTSQIALTGGIVIEKALQVINLKIINPVLNIINIVKDQVMDALRKVIDIVTEVFTKVSAGLSGMFNTVSSILYDVAKTLTKGGGYFVFFTFVNLLDLAIPLNISKSSKLNVVMVLLLSLVYIFIMYYALQFYYILPYVAVMLGLVIVPSYISMNNGPSEDPVPLQIEEVPVQNK